MSNPNCRKIKTLLSYNPTFTHQHAKSQMYQPPSIAGDAKTLSAQHALMGLLLLVCVACGSSNYGKSVWKDYDLYNPSRGDNDSDYRSPRGYNCDSRNFGLLGCE